MPQSIEEWWQTMPPITKAYFSAALATTMAITAGVVSPYALYLDFDLLYPKLEIWRLITTFTFFGKFSMPFVFQMFLLVQYGRSLELDHFQGNAGKAEMSFMLFCGAVLMWFASFVMGFPFLGTSMQFYILYIWSRKEPQRPVSVWGFGFKGWQLPFVMMAIGALMGGSITMDALGIICGHIFHFFADIVPLAYGVQLVNCPRFVYNWFEPTAAAARPSPFRGTGHRLGGHEE